MANNNDGQIVVGLDIPKSVSQINADIKKLEKQLEQVKATGALDTSATVKQINSQIATLQAQLKTITINANIDTKNVQKAGQQIGNQIKNATKGTSIASEILNASDLDKQGKTYILKVNNTIEATKKEIESKLRNAGYFDIEIKGIEKANGQIKSLTVSATNAKGVFEQLNFERAKMQKGGKVTNALVQTDDVKVVGNLSSSIEKVQGNLTTLKNKWEEQGVLVGDFKTKVEQLETSLASVGSKGELNGLKTQIETLKTEASTIADVNKIQLLSNGGVKNDYATQIATLEGQFRSLGLAQDTISAKTQGVKDSLATLRAEFTKPVDQQNFQVIETANNNLQRELVESTNEFKQLQASMKGMATEQQRLNLANTIEAWNQKNTKATKEVREQNDAYVRSLRDLGTAMTRLDFNKINTGFKQNENSMRTLHKLGASLKDQLKQAASSFTQWVSVSSAIMAVIYQLQKMPQKVKELDDAITDFTMATGANKAQISELTEVYSKLGDELSTTVTDVTISATEWLKQGKSIAETETLIRDAMVLSKVGKLSSADATKYLTSAMKGYKVSVEDTLSVVDKLSAVDMASATDVGGLAEGMSEVAASADLAGVSMDRLLGYLAAVGEVTQDSMSETGTTFNAIFSRMGNIKLARLKDYQNNGEDLSNVETVLRGVGIELRDSTDSFRDFDKVLDETASNWTNYSEVQQRAIASAFAGTQHLNEFIILMENYGKAVEYSEVSTTSSGEAMKKFEAYEESLTGKLEKLENAFIKLSNTVLDSGLLKGLVDLGTTGVKSIDGLVNALTPLGTIGLIGGGILSKNGIG